ncbi:hypothetical protein MBLNU230_g3198t1 [Neophaeotheca triangularis]
MPRKEFVPKTYTLADAAKSSGDASVHLKNSELQEHVDFSFEAVKPGVFRTTFTSSTHPLPPFPSATRPETDQSSFQTSSPSTTSKTLSSGDIEATVNWDGVPVVTLGYHGREPLYADLPHRSYALDGEGVAHYTKYQRGSLHVGLGEKAAPMDLSNRHFQLTATDCFGYDAMRSDPMYKHIPLMVRATPDGVVATFSTSHAVGYYSVGSEMDGMWGYFKVYRQDYGGLEQYTLIGRTLEEVVRLYADLVGFPILVPRWAFGYLAGGYKYAALDDPPAHKALMEFADKLEKYDVPCSGFQLSSGYTVAATEPKNRHVFTWNPERFPDPKGFLNDFHARGIRMIGNIKPYVLGSHEQYPRLAAEGGLFVDPRTKESAVCRLWSAGGGTSGEGGHIDFTSKAGYEFWYNGVKELRKQGMDCMWNDNNEYVVPSDDWMLELSHDSVGKALAATKEQRKTMGVWGRAMQTELNGKASYDALLDAVPEERPFVLTRSATAGTMKYAASSWSGDNVTSWDGMRGANAISLTAGMCLIQCYGHDIGGFEGPQPSPELLLRWVQLGCHSPRFAINCFKTGDDNNVGDVIEPWMYPHIMPEIRSAIMRRYEMIPYLYSLMLKSHFTAVPSQRWVGWGYETDSEVWTNKTLKDGEQQYWLGNTLMIGGVYEPGVSEAKVYLPKKSNGDLGFLNTNAPYQHIPAGTWASISSPWRSSIPILARIGGAVPVGKNKQVVAPGDRANEANLPADDWRGVEIFPPTEELSEGQAFTTTWMEDDGVSPPPAKVANFDLTYSATATEVVVSFIKEVKAFEPPWLQHGLTVILPVGDGRNVVSKDGAAVEARRVDISGRKRYHIRFESNKVEEIFEVGKKLVNSQ